MKMSWVTIDRFCHEETEVNEDIRHDLERNGKPLRSSAESLTDDELLTKLRDLGVDADRDGVERLCEDALSAEEVARLILDKLRFGDDIAGDCAAVTWSQGSGTEPTSRSGCSTYARTPGGPAKPGGSVSRPGACGQGQPAHPSGRRRHLEMPREQSKWDAIPRVLAGAGRSSRNAAVRR
jgi:hypothetical protein